jgi:RND superfamily putative drug exporter
MFARLARWVDRRAGWVVAAWLIGAVWLTLAAPSISRAGSADQAAFLPSSAPSRQADTLVHREFPDDPEDPAVIVVARRDGLSASDRRYLGDLVAYLGSPAAAEHVRGVQSAVTAPELAPILRSPDGEAELLVVALRAAVFTEGANRAVAFLRRHLDATAPAGLTHKVTGLGALASDQATAILGSFARTAVATVVLVLLILLVVYRSVLAPLVSLVSIGAAFLVARGVAGMAAAAGFKVASIVETFMVVMAFGAGTDYCLFVISRHRERLTAGEPPRQSLQTASTAVGPIITASAATVIVGFLGFLGAKLSIFHAAGPALGLAIAITLAAGLTLTPALLRLCGRASFWPSRPAQSPARRSAGWERLGGLVSRRPAAVLLIGLTLLAGPALGAFRLKESFDILSELPAGAGARQGFELLETHFTGGTVGPVFLVVRQRQPLTDEADLAAIDRLTEALRREPNVAEVRSITQPAGSPLTTATLARLTGGATDLKALGLDPDTMDLTPLLNAIAAPGGLRINASVLHDYPALRQRLGVFLGRGDSTTRLVVTLRGSPYARQSLEVVRHLDDRAAEVLAGSTLAGAQLAVAGPSAFFADIQDTANQDLRTVSAIVIGAVLIILALLLRSVVAPLYLLVSVLLSLAAALGITVGLFQGLLGQPGLAFWLPPFLFVILVALGADYNIFIASRIREELDAGNSVADAAREGLVLTGGTITSAGFILAGTFGALLLSPIASVQQIGFGIGVGVLLDTFVVRTLLVPAATMLLGRAAFWPSTSPSSSATGRRAALGLSGVGVAALAALLIALGLSGRPEAPILSVAAGPAAQPASGAGDGATTSPSNGSSPSSTAATAPRAAVASGATTTSATTRPDTTATSTAPSANPPSGIQASPLPAATSSTTTKPAAASPALTRVVIPAAGGWRYHVDGTRKVGLAGSTQPFSEDVTTQVSRTGGSDDAPELRLYTESGSGTVDEHRRYAPDAVDLLSLRVASAGLTYGGTFTPPQLLLPWPIRIGATWSDDWNTEDTHGHTDARILGERTLTIAGRALRCYDVQRDTTLTGAIQGTQHERACWNPDLGMTLTDDQTFQGTYQGIRFEAQATFTLRSPP